MILAQHGILRNIREAGGVTPPPYPTSGLLMHLDASTLTGYSNGNEVDTWTDLTSNSNDATQTNSAARPIYRTNQKNGHPIIDFESGNWMEVTGLTGISNRSLTTFGVFRKGAYVNNGVMMGHSGTTPYYRFHMAAESGEYNIATGNGASGLTVMNYSSAPPTNTWMVYGGTIDADGAGVLYLNGSQVGTKTMQYTSTWDMHLTTPSRRPLIGYMAEVFYYNRALSSTEIDTLETYLNDKWDVY